MLSDFGPPEPMVTLSLGSCPVQFLVDMGAELSILKTPLGELTDYRVPIQGATEEAKQYPVTSSQTVNLGRKQVTHSFLVVPECPYPLMGRDLLQKLGAQISFTP